uniref:Transcriptional regulator n=1 Tax=Ascaris lumbricoides TaxID=6252 RepID=A0A0M3I173_ASCLU
MRSFRNLAVQDLLILKKKLATTDERAVIYVPEGHIQRDHYDYLRYMPKTNLQKAAKPNMRTKRTFGWLDEWIIATSKRK